MGHITQTVQTSDAAIRLTQTSSQGYPVLLLHGSGACREAFRRQMDGPLGATYRMIAMDLPGHGESSDARDPQKSYSIAGLAVTVREVLHALGIERCAVWGWSLGGHVAIELMATSDIVSGLMITGTPPISSGPIGLLRGFQLSRDMLLVSKANFTHADAERLATLSFGAEPDPILIESAARADGRLRAAVSKSLMYGGIADQRLAVEHAAVPVAIVNGANDPFIRVAYAASLNIANLWDRVSIPDTGHAPFWEKPETFNLILQRFLFNVQMRNKGVKLRQAEMAPTGHSGWPLAKARIGR